MLSTLSRTRMALRHTLSTTVRRSPTGNPTSIHLSTPKTLLHKSPRRNQLSTEVTKTTTNTASFETRSAFPTFTSRQLATYGLIAALGAQSFFGSSSDFYEYRFVVKEDVDPDDLASFYGSESFMDIFCMFPLVGQFMMRGGTFDDNGVVHTFGFPGELLVSMAFTDETNEETDQVDWFNKRERFKNVFLGCKMWDQVSNFGFVHNDDGKIEVYHHGEYFVGKLPIISLGIKIIFQIHARYVAWATEHHINHHALSPTSEEDEEIEELSRTNHMLYMIKYHFWKDFKAMVGFVDAKSVDEREESFLTLKEDGDSKNKKTLPIKHKATLRKVHDSLEMDKELDLKGTGILDSVPNDNAYRMAREAALQKHKTLRLTKRNSLREEK